MLAEEFIDEAKFDENTDLEEISFFSIESRNSILLIVIVFSFFKLLTTWLKFTNNDNIAYINKKRTKLIKIIIRKLR